MSDSAFIEQARKRHKLATDYWKPQREREREDLRFNWPEYQWDEKAREERKGRPIMSISKIAQPQRLILNQMRAADLGINVHPVSEGASEETAETFQGMIRHIER